MRTNLILMIVITILLGAAAPVWAHHAFYAEFDSAKPLKLRGTVSKVELINPHSWFHIDVKDASGKVEEWSFEAGTPSGMIRNGYKPGIIKAGAEVTIKGFRARDGSNNASGGRVTFADGRSVFTASAEDARPD